MADPLLRIGEAGMGAAEEKMKALMNRMVNSETPGFKGSDVLVRSFPEELAAAEKKIQPMIPKVEGTYYNHLQGALIKTGNNTDLALGSKGFFVVLGPWGEGYTRDGRFKQNSQGHLLSTAGDYPLMGEGGPIEVPAGSVIEVTPHGDVKADGEIIDRIRVVNFQKGDEQQLVSLNGSIFKADSDSIEILSVEDPKIVQGYVEGSNVNVINQTMEMIFTQRVFNAETKLIQTRDTNLSRAISMGNAPQ